MAIRVKLPSINNLIFGLLVIVLSGGSAALGINLSTTAPIWDVLMGKGDMDVIVTFENFEKKESNDTLTLGSPVMRDTQVMKVIGIKK